MTDNEIVKANELCAKIPTVCEECPYYGSGNCVNSMTEDTTDLINRQQAEIERLKKLLAEADTTYNKCAKRFFKEAVKEFAERLCDDRVSNDPVVIAVKAELKEMVGDNNAQNIRLEP